MARSKKKHNGKKSFTLPISIVAGLAPGITSIITTAQAGGIGVAARTAAVLYTGYDYTTGQWNFANMKLGLLPLIAGWAVHKVAGMIGLNRAIAAAGIPVLRI